MSTGQMGGEPGSAGSAASEEELRAAYEAELKRIRIEHVLLEQVVSLINLGMRRTGLAPGTEDERDLGQVRLAIESVRALLPLVESSATAQAGPIRDALSQLQLAFVRLGGAAEGGTSAAQPGSPASQPGAPGPQPGGPASQSSGPAPQPGGSGPQPGGPGPPPGAPAPGSGAPRPGAPDPGEAGPAQRSGRLWIPGQ